MNLVVIFEDQATKQRQEGKPYPFASALKVQCPCGNLINPIAGAWCTRCGLKVAEVRSEENGTEISPVVSEQKDDTKLESKYHPDFFG